jgi:Na+-driven multidrug efflux pump
MGLFIRDHEVITAGASVLRLIAPIEPFFCLMMVITGILRAGGDTRFPLFAGICGMWGIRLGVAYIAVNFLGWGLIGAWIGMAADIMVRFTILAFRYGRMKWLNTDEI